MRKKSQGPMDEDEPVSSQDCFEVEDTVKDRSKWAKFKQLLDQGSLPDFITKAYADANKLKTGKEKAIRQMVNNVLDRDPKTGSLIVNVENPGTRILELYIHFVYCILLASCTFEACEPFQSCLSEEEFKQRLWMRSSMLWKPLMAGPSTAGMFQSML